MTTDIDDTAADEPARAGGRSFFNWKVIVLAVVLVIAAGGGAGYYFFGDRIWGHKENKEEAAKKQEAPLPFYLEVKPFVVSVMNDSGTPHFVQIGVNFTMPGSAAGNLVTALLPEVTDAMRQTVLSFKLDDIVTPAGVDKMREAMLAKVNEVLVRRLGAERVKSAADGQENAVQQIYFTTLIVE